MHSYVRPRIEAPVFRDAEGDVIDYGNRWGIDSPPEDTYSVDTHPERFAPLHAVADALIDHVCATYDVTVQDDLRHAGDLCHPRDDVIRAVRLTPADRACATMTLAYSSYPAVTLHAGLLHDFTFPHCGCDACDLAWESEAEELEQHVLAVAAGGFRETISAGRRPKIGSSIEFPNGGATSGWGSAEGRFDHPLRQSREIRARLPERWAPWPRRSG